MRNADIALLTVVGDDEADFDLLLGSLAYHMEAGFRRVVWHTGDRPARGIAWPAGVEVLHHPGYGAGEQFNYGHALNDATLWITEHTDCVGVLRVDACEFWPRDWRASEVVRRGRIPRVGLAHHVTPALQVRKPNDTRLVGWPLRGDRVWHGPGFHPVIVGTRPPEVDLSDAVNLPRLRLALGPRSETAPRQYHDPNHVGWKLEATVAAWPKQLLDWRRTGRRPSVDFCHCDYGVPRIFA